jgi:hypothetical protein
MEREMARSTHIDLLPAILLKERNLTDVDFDYSKIDQPQIEKLMVYAEKNGLKYLLVNILINNFKNSSILPTIESERALEIKKSEKFKESLHFLTTLTTEHNIPYILVKSFDSFDHIPNDIDIFIKNEDRIRLIDLLSRHDMTCQQSSVTETKLQGKFMNTDLYTRINYLGLDFVENDLLWKSVIDKQFSGEMYKGLNPAADLLMLIPHSLFGHRRMTLLDFLHFMTLKKHADIEYCREYAIKQGWGYIFESFMALQESLENEILIKKTKIRFPFYYPKDLLMNSISHTKKFQFNLKNKFFFSLSFWAEGLVYSMEDGRIYNALKSNEKIRTLFNSMCSFFKRKRGDIKSSD